MSQQSHFDLLQPGPPPTDCFERMRDRQRPETLGDLQTAAPYYQPGSELIDAVNVALTLGAPLLITGEPGTGKTQVAYYLAWYFGLIEQLYTLDVRSDTTVHDLLYHFDAVRYLHAAHDPTNRAATNPLDKKQFIQIGPLWKAYLAAKAQKPAIVLIDEIDKAPRDFPNDLLNVLDQHQFRVPEIEKVVRCQPDIAPPMVVITSNSERRLPEPFLRRCIFHHIRFDEELVRKAVTARGDDFPNLSDELRAAAIDCFLDLRSRELRKPPATAELLVWMTVLSAKGNIQLSQLQGKEPRDLPALAALIKDRDDLERLGINWS